MCIRRVVESHFFGVLQGSLFWLQEEVYMGFLDGFYSSSDFCHRSDQPEVHNPKRCAVEDPGEADFRFAASWCTGHQRFRV